jgi:hypothetical protein
MQCPRCRDRNETGAKFCEECASLARTRAKRGRQLSQTAKSCPECWHPTEPFAVRPPARRFGSPETYTAKHLAEKILTIGKVLEGVIQLPNVLIVAVDPPAQHWTVWKVGTGCISRDASARFGVYAVPQSCFIRRPGA